jgi:GAF domain-containing protein
VPIDFSQLLLKPGPSQGFDLSGVMAIQQRREAMRAQREEFAERKRQHQEMLAFRKMEEENEMARAYLAAQSAEEGRRAEIEKAAEKTRTDAEAALLAKRQEQGAKFLEHGGEGRVQQMEAMVPLLESLGSGATNLGTVGGLPTYRYVQDAKKDRMEQAAREAAQAPRGPDETVEQSARRMETMGYPTDERGTLGDPLIRQDEPVGGVATVDGGAPEFDEETEAALAATLSPEAAARVAQRRAERIAAQRVAGRQAAEDARPSSEIYGADEVPLEEPGGVPPEAPPAPEGMGPGALSMDDAYARALKASAYGRRTGQPIRRDEEDYTGAVPRNVIDMGANEKQTLARLNPALKGLVAAYPDSHRASAEGTADAVRNMPGLTMEARLAAYEKARGGADTAINTGLGLEAQRLRSEDEREARQAMAREARQAALDKPLTPMAQQELVQRGYTRGNTSFTKEGIAKRLDATKAADQVIRLLENGDSYDDPKVVNYLMMLNINKGHQTINDEHRMTGLATASSVDQAIEWLHERFKGGFGPELRASLIGYARAIQSEEKGRIFGWMDQMHKQAENNRDLLVRQGYLDFLDDNINDPDILKEYESREVVEEEDPGAPDEPEPPAGAGGAAPTAPGQPRPIGSVHPASYYQPGQKMPADAPRYDSATYDPNDGFDAELDKQAKAAGLTPSFIRKFMLKESGADPAKQAGAVSSAGARGIFQLMPMHIRKLGNMTPDAYGKLSRTEQIPLGIKYLKSRGLGESSNPSDYAMAIAAPFYMGKPDDTVIEEYAKGSAAWEGNPGWRPKDGGPITVRSILHYYGLRPDDGSTGPALKEGGKKAPESVAETDIDQEVLDLLDAP